MYELLNERMQISIIHPSRGRAAMAQDACRAWLDKCSNVGNIEYILSLDYDDKENQLRYYNLFFEQIKKAIEDHIDDFDEINDEKPQNKARARILELSKTKIRMEVLERCYNLILFKALNPNVSALEQARFLGVSKEKVALLDEALALKEKVGKTAAEYDKVANIHEYQINIKAVVWKYTRRAYLLAENAARGEFPSFKEFDERKPTAEFAYEHIAEMAKQIQEKMKLDGIEKKFSDEFMASEQIERCYSTFPKYYEVIEDVPKGDRKPKTVGEAGELAGIASFTVETLTGESTPMPWSSRSPTVTPN